MKKIILKVGIAILSVIYALMKLFPQDKNRVVFISRESDTPNVDFCLLAEQLKLDWDQCRIVMLCRKFVSSESSLGDMIQYGFHMLRQMHHIARARVALLDTYCIPISLFSHRESLLVVQLWHAMGSMKKFGYAMIGKEEGSSAEIAEIMKMHRGYDYMTISSFSFLKDYLEGFQTTKEKVVEIPLPKADLLVDPVYGENCRKKFIELHPETAAKKNILYCPTFRKGGEGAAKAAASLMEYLDTNKYNLIIKPHPLERMTEMPDQVITTDWPTYDVLFIADYVISDYSSVIYEAGLAGKPIFAYAYDWNDYSNKREINFDIEHEFPGLFTGDPRKIIEAIMQDDYDIALQRDFIQKNVVMPEGMTCREKLSEFIRSHLK